MHIGIISDTHSNSRIVQKAIEIFNTQGVGCVLHAGDIVSPSTISLFSEFNGRLIAVFGNCDSDRTSLRAAVQNVGGEIHDHTYDGQVDGKAVYMTHIPFSTNQAAGSKRYDLVIYGHTHRQDIHRVRDTLVVNPGAGQAVIINLADMTTTAVALV
jgi:uncharacterized protein